MSAAIALWRENRLDQEYSATLDELAARFLASEYADLERYPWPFERRVAAWLAEVERASVEEPDQRRIEDACWAAERAS